MQDIFLVSIAPIPGEKYVIALVLLGIHKHISVVNIHYICFVFGCRLTATRISIATLNEKKFCKRKQKIQRERESNRIT